jgi:diguanylate cyclase (GGDEF)-like protein/PAS domain S-box-containing protein
VDLFNMVLANFYLELHYEKNLLIINGVFIGIAVAIYFSKQRFESSLDKLPLLVATPNLSLQFSDHLLINYFPDFLCLKDKDGRWLKASRDYLEILNLQNIDYNGKMDVELAQYPNCNMEALKISIIQDKSAWHLKQPTKETRTFSHPGKPDRTLVISRIPVFDVEQERFRLIVTGTVAEVAHTYKEENKRLKLISHVFNECHLSFALLDEQFRIKKINIAFSDLTGYHINEIENKCLSSIIFEEASIDVELANANFFKTRDQKYLSCEMVCKPKSGPSFPVKLDITLVNKDNREVVYFVTMSDISRQKLVEKRIMRIAYYDELTGLANRAMFYERLGQYLSTSQRYQLHAIVFFIDLDRFKAVNDSMGHDAGDDLLKETAKRLLSITRKGDIAARLSGDEFALVMFNEKSHEQAIYSAALIAKKIIQQLSEGFYIQRREVFIGSSIGISIYPEDGASAEALLKNADIAMYHAKNHGRNNYQFYTKDFTIATQDRLTLELDLRKAISKNELQLYYQPQYKANGREFCGAEVLIRWFHGGLEQKKMIPPAYFIPVAEDTSLIIDIGEWILRTACVQLKAWIDEGYLLRQISVNISARQFSDPNFLKIVEDALKDAELAPEHLELEITESMLIGDTKNIELKLHRLKKMGIKIALDDFGTGYSSLSYLKNFPIDILKIDQSFIREMTTNSKDARIASAIIEMGHSLGQKIVAEGVETEEQLLFLLRKECDIVQGYYFSPPVPRHKMTTMLRAELAEVSSEKVTLKDFFE